MLLRRLFIKSVLFSGTLPNFFLEAKKIAIFNKFLIMQASVIISYDQYVIRREVTWCASGVSLILISILWGHRTGPQNPVKGGMNRLFHPNWQKLNYDIIRKWQIRYARNLVGKYGLPNSVRTWCRITIFILWQVRSAATINIMTADYAKNGLTYRLHAWW